MTVYKSNNCGSFWQAYCLQEAVKRINPDCGMLIYKPSIRLSPQFYEVIHIGASLVKLRPKVAGLKISKWYKFYRCRKRMLTNMLSINRCDYVIIGSDTLWNVTDYYFKAMIAYYTGNDLSGKPFSVFGTSSGQAALTDLYEYKREFSNLNSAEHIFVRDENTAVSIRELINYQPGIVCDPTLLFDKSFYKRFVDKSSEHNRKTNRYVLLYLFGDVDEKTKSAIIEFARNQKYQIVSIDKNFKWADKVVSGGPVDFVTLFADSAFVFTDTFHGTVFSTIFEKQFIVLSDKKTKINEYLSRIGLLNRVVNNHNSIHYILNSNIDYEYVNGLIDQMRTDSLQDLNRVVAI